MCVCDQEGGGCGVCVSYRAAAPVATRVPRAVVDLYLAAGPAEARPTGAGVAALARVAARRPVQTGLVVGAVVQIWGVEGWRGWREKDTCGLDTAAGRRDG